MTRTRDTENAKERLMKHTRPTIRTSAAALLLTALAACDCELPDTYRGATLDGCSEAGDVTCCSYSDSRCSYTLCQTACGDHEETSWYCF